LRDGVGDLVRGFDGGAEITKRLDAKILKNIEAVLL